MRRRRILSLAGTLALVGTGGCTGSSRPPPGGIEIRNDDDRAHSVTVAAAWISEDTDDAPVSEPDSVPTPKQTPKRRRERRFDVPADDSVTDPQFLTEPGAHYVTVELDSGDAEATWIGLYRSAVEGDVGGETLIVSIQEGGRLSLSATIPE